MQTFIENAFVALFYGLELFPIFVFAAMFMCLILLGVFIVIGFSIKDPLGFGVPLVSAATAIIAAMSWLPFTDNPQVKPSAYFVIGLISFAIVRFTIKIFRKTDKEIGVEDTEVPPYDIPIVSTTTFGTITYRDYQDLHVRMRSKTK